MRTTSLLALAFLFASVSFASAGVERFELENGVRVVLHPYPKSGGVTVAIAFATGRDDDPGDALGRAHLIEHMLIRAPTPSFPKHGGALDALGGFAKVNGATLLGATYYYVMTDAKGLARVCRIMSEQVRSAKITGEAIAIEAKRIRDEEIANVRRRTAFVLLEATMRAGYPERGIGHPSVLGEEPGKQDAEDVADRFASAKYGPDRLVVVVTGDANAKAARRAIETTFGRLPKREVEDDGAKAGALAFLGGGGKGEPELAPPADDARRIRVASPAGDASAVLVYAAEPGDRAAQVAAALLQSVVFGWRVDPDRPSDPMATASTGAAFHLGAKEAALAVWLTRKTPEARDALVAKWNETLASLAKKGVADARVAPLRSQLVAALSPERMSAQIAFVPAERRAMAIGQLAINHAISEATVGPHRDEIRKAIEAVDGAAVTEVLRRWAKEGPRAEGRADPEHSTR